jgi:hypothetical protein
MHQVTLIVTVDSGHQELISSLTALLAERDICVRNQLSGTDNYVIVATRKSNQIYQTSSDAGETVSQPEISQEVEVGSETYTGDDSNISSVDIIKQVLQQPDEQPSTPAKLNSAKAILPYIKDFNYHFDVSINPEGRDILYAPDVVFNPEFLIITISGQATKYACKFADEKYYISTGALAPKNKNFASMSLMLEVVKCNSDIEAHLSVSKEIFDFFRGEE